MKLQLYPYFIKYLCPVCDPHKNLGTAYDTLLYLHFKNEAKTAQVHANSYKVTKVYNCTWIINICNFYVNDNEIYCNRF